MNKSDFPIYKNHPQLVYLDNAATSHKPQAVIDAVVDFYTKHNSNVHRGIHSLAESATLLYENARKTVADFLGADTEEIIFTSGTTELINLMAQMLATYYFSKDIENSYASKTKKSILISEMEHHSNLIPWQKLATRLGWDIEFIKTTTDFQLDEEDLRKKLSREVAVLALTHMSNVLGTINDIETICSLAKQINPNIVTVIDGAQYLPHHKFNLGKQKDIDLYCFSGHKLLGPTGIGAMYGKKDILEKLEPAKFGGGMISKVERTASNWAELPEKFEAGTPNIAGAIGLGAAFNYLENLDQKKLENHMRKITNYAYTQLVSLPEVKLFHPTLDTAAIDISTNNNATAANNNVALATTSSKSKQTSGPVFSFSVSNIHPHDVAQLLDQDNIAIRAGHHCCQILHREVLNIPATNRVSLYFYNETEDIDRFIKSLKEIIVKFR